jgi:hypothetical protein
MFCIFLPMHLYFAHNFKFAYIGLHVLLNYAAESREFKQGH